MQQFMECAVCGERWAVASLPCPLSVIAKLKPMCPNCNETRKLWFCNSMGEGAVTEPRKGNPL